MSIHFVYGIFIVKHFICDFVLQYPRHYLNKGVYGAWGGIEHALIHGIGTFCVFYFLNLGFFISLLSGLFDMMVHYHIDYIKMNVNDKLGYKCNTHEQFWVLLGLDQMFHYITYVILISYNISL